MLTDRVLRPPAPLICIAILVVFRGECAAHPSSHVDAWVRIGTHLDVRVTLFLDNVLAWQNIRPATDDSLVPAEVAARAVDDFGETLQSLLTVYDRDGRQLEAEIVGRPMWKPAAADLDLAADAGLRLTWKLRYPWNQEHRSFSLRHCFAEHRGDLRSAGFDLPLDPDATAESEWIREPKGSAVSFPPVGESAASFSPVGEKVAEGRMRGDRRALRYATPPLRPSSGLRRKEEEQQTVSTPHPADQSAFAGEPAELRLRVRDAQSGRRVDAVIGYHQPHTILLPDGTADPQAGQNHTPATVRFVLLPRLLVHEFALPLALASAATAVDGSERPVDSRRPALDSEAVLRRAEDWVRDHCRMQMDGRAVPAQSISVSLLTAENQELDSSDSVALIGTRLGIRTTHPLGMRPGQIVVFWNAAPREVTQIQLHTIDGASSSSQIADCGDANFAGDGLQYVWELPSPADSPGGSAGRQSGDSGTTAVVAAAESWQAGQPLWLQHPQPAVVRGLLWAAMAAAAVGVIVGIRRKWRASVKTATVGLVVLAGSAVAFTEPVVELNPVAATQLIDRMLNQVYRAVLVRDQRSAVEQLSEVLTDDLVETVFRQMAGTAGEAPFVRLSDVRLVSCQPRGFVANESAGFSCQWQIDGEILHWGHRHQRQMLLAGVIQVESVDGECRICDIVLDRAEYSAGGSGS